MRRLRSAMAVVLVGCAPAASTPPPPATVEVPPAPAVTAEPTAEAEPTTEAEPPVAETPGAKLEMQLPGSSDPLDTAPVSVLMITKQGDLIFEGRVLKDLASLEAEAARVATSREDPSVVIMADASVLYRRVVEAMDALKRGGITKFALAVESPTSGKAAPPPTP